ncbi:MAG: ribosome small subunit-dependent GTPase, partial [Methanomethylovorans sp.]|nr:ribosome small subunit-dependent GTPase [Methanomethylovorans sp.]
MDMHSLPKNSYFAAKTTIPGWDEELGSAFSAYKGPYIAGRIVSRHKTNWDVLIASTTIKAGSSGALLRIGKQ